VKKLLIALALSVFATGVMADDKTKIKGTVETNSAVGAVIQSSGGLANDNEATVGSVTGGAEISKSGSFKSNQAVGTVVQSSGGLANKNEAHIGSVSD
jgi:hypothetical protein